MQTGAIHPGVRAQAAAIADGNKNVLNRPPLAGGRQESSKTMALIPRPSKEATFTHRLTKSDPFGIFAPAKSKFLHFSISPIPYCTAQN